MQTALPQLDSFVSGMLAWLHELAAAVED